MAGGSNGAEVIVNGGANTYDRAICFDAPVAFDSGLFVDPSLGTLGSLRAKLNLRLGFGANAIPSPGHNELLNEFLADAQEQAYWRYEGLRTERWWGWQTNPGQRFYDVPIDCTKALEFRKITWAGVADGLRAVTLWDDSAALSLGQFIVPTIYRDFDYEVTVAGTTGAVEPTWPTVDGATVVDGTVTFTARAKPQAQWYPLTAGIPPQEYTRDTVRMRPTRYELREYLEVFPAPDKAYVVWLKGHMGLRRFTQDADTTTIDARAVLLLALANAKAHYGQPDANNYVQQFEVLIRKYTAGTHGTRRYVPGDRRPPEPAKPRTV